MDRKEAIEVVKKNYPHVATSGSAFETALRELVPELAESEDEKNWKAVLGYVKDDALRVWLEKQKGRKPAGWSEEESAIIDGIIQDVRNAKMLAQEDVDCPASKEELDAYDEELDFLNRLKSLRPQPQWKPSEAQKNALKDVLDMAEAYGILQKMGRTYDDIIELQNDLEEEF